MPPEPKIGTSDGVFYVYTPPGSWAGWNVHTFDPEVTCEVIGRVSGDDPMKRDAWYVLIDTPTGSGRGVLVKINGKGELFVEPSPWAHVKAFTRIDPKGGPINHPWIKPGSEYNKLLLILRKREVAILVNGVQVCGSIKLGYDIIPGQLQLGATGPGAKLAEFDRTEIREIINP